MADIQTQFNKYHQEIKLNDIEDNKILREKRDMLLKELRTHLSKEFKDKEESTPTFSHFNQGSYSMGTGVKPLEDDDYDIDVGLHFNILKTEYKPLEVKGWVLAALNKVANRDVKIRRPCVTVKYTKKGEDAYHVDFAVYAYDKNDNAYLAKGFVSSPEVDKIWESADPEELKKKINGIFADDDERMQFKRVIRYLKRWKGIKFKTAGDNAPTGIALTALAYNHFKPVIIKNVFENSTKPNDLKALLGLVKAILGQFKKKGEEHVISVSLPVKPYNNLFEKMTDKQMTTFRSRLESLKKALETATVEVDPHEACKILAKELGDDFPIPKKQDTGQKLSGPAVISSTHNA